MSSEEVINTLKEEVSENLESAPSVESMPIEFVSGSQKLKKLLNTSENIEEKFRKGEHSISIDETFLLRNIQFKTESSLKDFSSNFELNARDTFGNWTNFKPTLKNNSGFIFIPINKIINRLELVSKGKISFKKRPNIEKISVYGYREKDFENIAKFASELLDLRSNLQGEADKLEKDLSEHQEKIVQLEEKEAELTTSISSLATENSESQEELEITTTELSSSKEKLSEIEEKTNRLYNSLDNIENSIEEKTDEKSKLVSSINTLKSELRALTEDKNTFSSELADYINEGEKNIKKYYWLASIPVTVMSVLTMILVYNSTQLFQYDGSLENILGTILSRMPFTLATIGLITASYKICKYFISEMTKIYNERLSMTKLSIIAKEVSNSVFDEENDPEFKYALRAQLKMDLLKHYMKNEIGESFQLTQKENTKKDERTEEANEDDEIETQSVPTAS